MRVTGGVPVSVPYRVDAEGRFSLPLADIEAALTPRTRVIMVNSPSNPTGWIMPADEMVALRDLARERGLWILADEVYAHFTYDGPIAPSFLQICTRARPADRRQHLLEELGDDRLARRMADLPKGLAETFAKLGQYNTTSIPTFVQHAAVTALDEGDGFIRTMVGRCAEARAILIDGLSRLPGASIAPPEGGLPHGPPRGGRAEPALRPPAAGAGEGRRRRGYAFGPEGEGFVRLCYAISPELAQEAVRRYHRPARALRPSGHGKPQHLRAPDAERHVGGRHGSSTQRLLRSGPMVAPRSRGSSFPASAAALMPASRCIGPWM